MVYLSQTMRLEQRLSPQQILLSTLLQLPILNLEQKIQTELELNPVLEEGLEDEQEMELETPDANAQEEEAEVKKEIENTDGSDNGDLDLKELKEAQEDIDWNTMLNDEDSYEIRIPRDKNEEDYERPEVVVTTMIEYLLEQLNFLSLSETEHKVGDYLIWNIKDDGYLDENLSIESVAQIFNCDIELVERVLDRIQHFEPLGIGARNLRECLLAQLTGETGFTELAITIVRNHFEDFKNRRYEKLLSELQIEREELKSAIEEIARLNPKPGEGLYNAKHNYIVPDFIVEKVDDEFVVSLNDWNIPPLRISRTYRQSVAEPKENRS